MMRSAMAPERLSLQLTEADRDAVGWGLGFYEDGEPLIRKCPMESPPKTDLLEVAGDIRTDVLIGHVRAPTVGSLRAENTHPFRFRQWLFVHSGTIERFSEVKGKMLDSMPSFLQRSLGGETDSECFFHLVMAFLHDSGQLASPDLKIVSEALIKSVEMVDELENMVGGDRPSPYNILMTNGYMMLALHRSSLRMGYLTFEAPGRGEIRPRAVLVACEHTAAGSRWIDLPTRSILQVKRDLTVEVTEF
jgi:glutamine amidotransferase